MACICLGEAPRVPQQQEILLTSNSTDKNLISMPSISNDLFDTETVSDQTNQASSPSPIHVFNAHRYLPPTTYSTDSQATPYLPTSISLNLVPQSSSLSISLTILPGSILSVITDPQQYQPLDWIPILPIPNHFKEHPHSYICTTIDHIPKAKILEVVQLFLKEPMPTSQQLKLVHRHHQS